MVRIGVRHSHCCTYMGTLTAAHSVGDLVFRDSFLFDVN